MTFQLTQDSIDKWFKTRDGRKVKCVYHYKDRYFEFYDPECMGELVTVFDNGYVTTGDVQTNDDIISEWHEPIEREVTVYLWKCGKVTQWGSTPMKPDIIASAKVKLIEGVFQ